MRASSLPVSDSVRATVPVARTINALWNDLDGVATLRAEYRAVAEAGVLAPSPTATYYSPEGAPPVRTSSVLPADGSVTAGRNAGGSPLRDAEARLCSPSQPVGRRPHGSDRRADLRAG